MLDDRRQLIVILRLVVDRWGLLSHGEVVDLDGTSLGRFTDWRKVTPIVRTWVQSRRADDQPEAPNG
jgi:hypothetical protein